LILRTHEGRSGKKEARKNGTQNSADHGFLHCFRQAIVASARWFILGSTQPAAAERTLARLGARMVNGLAPSLCRCP